MMIIDRTSPNIDSLILTTRPQRYPGNRHLSAPWSKHSLHWLALRAHRVYYNLYLSHTNGKELGAFGVLTPIPIPIPIPQILRLSSLRWLADWLPSKLQLMVNGVSVTNCFSWGGQAPVRGFNILIGPRLSSF